ncbi:MAG TPA: pyridoxal phosphate-dependent aminotransferase [Xanthobacteraceae bacterium]|jgi:aspartate/methionine/tyrosine aminotransferase
MSTFAQRNAHFDRLFANKNLLWLGQNTNHLPMHPQVREALSQSIAAEEFHAYAPPGGFTSVLHGIVDDLGLPHETTAGLITDGAVAALATVCRAYCEPHTSFVTTDPGWKWPLQFARQAGAEIREIAIYDPDQGYRLAPQQLNQNVDRSTRIIYLVDPNNPLGICYTREEIRAFCDTARSTGALILHDCTYRDFADDHVLAARFYPEGAVTIYSFSKWLGLAGLRIGAVVASKAIIERLAAYSTATLGSSVIAQRAAQAGLAVKKEWMSGVQRIQRRNQAAIKKTVDSIPGLFIPVYPSQGNFVIIECAALGLSPEALAAVFAQRGIMIRQGSYHTPRFGSRFVKVSTTVPTEWADAFCRELPDAVVAARGLNDIPELF